MSELKCADRQIIHG